MFLDLHYWHSIAQVLFTTLFHDFGKLLIFFWSFAWIGASKQELQWKLNFLLLDQQCFARDVKESNKCTVEKQAII